MISYVLAARELDARWTSSLQFLPPTPVLRSTADSISARLIATTEIDLFNRYAKEVAAEHGLKLGVLVDLCDMLLMNGLMEASNLDERRITWRRPSRRSRAVSAPAPKSSRPEQYREKYNLPRDYPMVAPSYAKKRSELAKSLGLGQLGRMGRRKKAAQPPPKPRGGGREKAA